MAESPQIPNAADSPGFTWRSILIGIVMVLVIGCGAPYVTLYQVSSVLFLDYSTAGATFLLFMLVLVFNLLLGRFMPSARLSRAELSLVAVMMIVAAALPTFGLVCFLLPGIAAPHYYASSQRWAATLEPDIWERLVPVDWSAIGPERFEAVNNLFDGLPITVESPWVVIQNVPWHVWVVPLLVWGIFLAALYTVMVTTMVLVRKQWIENERLIFPIAQVPMTLARGTVSDDSPRPIWRSTALWIGIGIPAVISTLRAMPSYIEHFPTSFTPGPMRTNVEVFQGLLQFPLWLSFPMIGFAFLINRSISFSVWFFSIVSVVLIGVFRKFDIKLVENLGIYGSGPRPILGHIGAGALLVLVLVGLWVARHHLRDVLRKAFLGAPDVDDSGEIISYRTAVVLWLWGMGTMVVWMRLAGLPLHFSLMFIFLAIVVFLGLTRIVCEGGMAVAQAPLGAQHIVTSGFGAGSIGPGGMTAMAFGWTWMGITRTSVMTSAAHGLRLVQGTGNRRRRWIALAIVLAIVLAAVASIVMVLALTHRYGGLNLIGGGLMTGKPQSPYRWAWWHLHNATTPSGPGLAWTGVGVAVMAILLLGRRFFLWWPLHPIGFPLASVNTTIVLWVNVFIAWATKSTVVKYGGPQLYQRTRPFFLGLILGQFAISGVWVLIDLLAGVRENQLFVM